MPAPPAARAAGEERRSGRRSEDPDARASRPLVAGGSLVLAGAVVVTVYGTGSRVDPTSTSARRSGTGWS